VSALSESIQEIIRVLQLTSPTEEQGAFATSTGGDQMGLPGGLLPGTLAAKVFKAKELLSQSGERQVEREGEREGGRRRERKRRREGGRKRKRGSPFYTPHASLLPSLLYTLTHHPSILPSQERTLKLISRGWRQ